MILLQKKFLIQVTALSILEILGNSNSSGGSTITQQLIKNKILGSQRTYKRKMQEAYLALQLEKVVDKDQILEAYLNDIYLGGSNYGVKAAAKDYFGKELSELTIRECALLAGLTQSPYYYNPRQNMYYRDGNPYYRTVNRTNIKSADTFTPTTARTVRLATTFALLAEDCIPNRDSAIFAIIPSSIPQTFFKKRSNKKGTEPPDSVLLFYRFG